MSFLAYLGAKHGTDKVDHNHTFANNSYLHIYEQYLEKRRTDKLKVLEIGVLNGSSLRMWKEYFPNSNIYGFDINPDCSRFNEERIDIVIGNQKSEQDLCAVLEKASINKDENVKETKNGFDFILDDGSHIINHMCFSFDFLFKYLNQGGIYIIEDLANTYVKLQTGEYNVREVWPGMKYNDPDENLDNDREVLNRFFFEKIRQLDHGQGDIFAIHFYNMNVIIQKV